MAEFCQRCADNLNLPEAELTIKGLGLSPGHYEYVLCEGCDSYIFVANVGGKDVVFRPDTPTIW